MPSRGPTPTEEAGLEHETSGAVLSVLPAPHRAPTRTRAESDRAEVGGLLHPRMLIRLRARTSLRLCSRGACAEPAARGTRFPLGLAIAPSLPASGPAVPRCRFRDAEGGSRVAGVSASRPPLFSHIPPDAIAWRVVCVEPPLPPPGKALAAGSNQQLGEAAMSESGHSQPGLYGIERRRRWKEPSPGGPQNLSGPGGREREHVAPWERERRDGSEETGASVMQKTPIILSKPPAERSKQPAPQPAPAAPLAPAPLEKPIVLMKPREEGKGPTAVPSASTPEGAAPPPPVAPTPPKGEKEGQRPTQPVYQIQNRGMGTATPAAMDPVVGQAKLLPPERMKHSIKLVDDQMNWCDSAIEYLLDQTDVLVVGVLGLQGTGKSMVMSLLSANTPEEDQRAYVFRAQSAEMKERGGNQTSGIDFFITQERIVFLDTQPILSPSILDHLINNDRKLPPEYSLPHTYVEMQSLQIAAFLFTVCHVVIVVQDWFTDLSLYRFLQTAEMVKPSTPSPSHESSSSSGSEEGTEYYPHLVFLQNKARREDFCPRKLRQMHLMIDQLMAHSHLRYKGTLSMLQCNVFPGLPPDFLDSEVNLFLVPFMDSEAESETPPRAGPTSSPLFSLLPGYRGHPSFQSLVSKLRSQVMSMARPQLSHTILTEKNWFHYAARIWDGVKKSSALAEYSRLLA